MTISRPIERILNLSRLWTRARPAVGLTPADVVHRENKWRLLRYRARPEGLAFRTPLLLVPSPIHRHYVLDLMPVRSLTEYLVAQGHDVFTIDWGTPEPEDRFLTFDDVCDRYLGRALRLAASHSPRDQAHVLGHGLGGTLATIHAAARPEHVASLVLISAPVGFHDEGLLSTWMRSPTFDARSLVEAYGNVPWQLTQPAFHLLRPTRNLSKAVYFLDRAWDDGYLDAVLALETWANDGIAFPGGFFLRYAEDLYRRDALLAGTMTLSDRPARLKSIGMPLLSVTLEHDDVVPWQSAAVLMHRVSSLDKERIHLPGGHVDALVSESAAKGLWPKISAWWAARDTEVTAAPPMAPKAATRRRRNARRNEAV